MAEEVSPDHIDEESHVADEVDEANPSTNDSDADDYEEYDGDDDEDSDIEISVILHPGANSSDGGNNLNQGASIGGDAQSQNNIRPDGSLPLPNPSSLVPAEAPSAADATLPNPDESVYDEDLENLVDKPWRRPGADRTDYFNYNFTEITWPLFCKLQKTVRAQVESIRTGGPMALNNLQKTLVNERMEAISSAPMNQAMQHPMHLGMPGPGMGMGMGPMHPHFNHGMNMNPNHPHPPYSNPNMQGGMPFPPNYNQHPHPQMGSQNVPGQSGSRPTNSDNTSTNNTSQNPQESNLQERDQDRNNDRDQDRDIDRMRDDSEARDRHNNNRFVKPSGHQPKYNPPQGQQGQGPPPNTNTHPNREAPSSRDNDPSKRQRR